MTFCLSTLRFCVKLVSDIPNYISFRKIHCREQLLFGDFPLWKCLSCYCSVFWYRTHVLVVYNLTFIYVLQKHTIVSHWREQNKNHSCSLYSIIVIKLGYPGDIFAYVGFAYKKIVGLFHQLASGCIYCIWLITLFVSNMYCSTDG